MIKKTFYTILILLTVSIVYLNFLGISTNKFNQKIENKFGENYSGINIKLNKVKLLLDVSTLSVNLETENAIISSEKEKIKLEKISTKYDAKSFFTKKFAVKNLSIDSKKNQIKKFIKLARSYKDSPQLLILDKLVKTGDVKTSIKLNFDENGKLAEDKYEVLADISNLSLELPNKQKISNISGTFKYTHGKIEINNLLSDYQDIKLYSQNISINKKNKFYIVKGDLNSKEGDIKESIIKTLFNNDNLKDIVLSSKNNFSFNISKKFKISNIELLSDINLEKAHYNFDNAYIKKYIPNFEKKITFSKQKINIKYKKKIFVEGSGNLQIGGEKDDIKYKLEHNKKDTKFELEFDIKKIPLKIDLINFAINNDQTANLKIEGEKKKKFFFIQ